MTSSSSLPAIPASIQSASDDLLVASRSPATLRAYRSDWKAFTAWCDSQGVPFIPAQPEIVAAWVASQMKAGKKASTISRSVASISCAHETAGFSGFGRSQLVKSALKGMRRTVGVSQNKKAAATNGRVLDMIGSLPDTLAGTRDRAILTLGFAGAFRRSELVALNVEDIEMTAQGARCHIRRSKTDQEGAGQTVTILEGGILGVLDNLRKWLSVAGITSGPIFRRVSKSGVVGERLAPESVGDIVKKAAQKTGLDPASFGGHSLRSGFITSSAAAGNDAMKIAHVSRHKCMDVLQGYVRRVNDFENHPGKGVA